MKKIISMVVSLTLITSIAIAYTVTVRIGGIGGGSTSETGNNVQIIPKVEIEGWEVESGGITVSDNHFIMPENNVAIKGIVSSTTPTGNATLTVNPGGTTYTQEYNTTKSVTAPTQSYTVTYNYNGSGASNTTATANRTFSSWTLSGGGSISSTTENPTTYTYGTSNGTLTANYGGASSVTLPSPTREGYTLTGWYTAASEGMKVGDAGASYTPTEDVTLYAVWEASWNAPKLGTGMTPVNWNGSTWVDTTESNWDYNYEIATAGHGTVAGDGTGKWANARTADGSMYVWIPRYSYKITIGEHQDVDSWSSVDTPGTGKIEVKFSNGTVDDTSDSYIAHPAFTFGTDELKGFWVAKYEASRNDATASSVGIGTTVSSKPGVKSWTDISISNMYDYAYNLNRTLDSHLMRNSEWGAVAYLTNAIGKIPYINNYFASSSPYLVTGYAGASQDEADVSGNANSYLWNTANGVKASSTHNVYGIYDLSGGADEYVSAYVDNGNSNLNTYANNLVTNKETKYVEVYPMGTSDSIANNYAAWSNIKGDAVYETSSSYSGGTSWDGDCSIVANSSNPVFLRGGSASDTSRGGVFYFYAHNGEGRPGDGFRAALAIK